VRQVEKAALKKAAKSSGPFSRELVELCAILVPSVCVLVVARLTRTFFWAGTRGARS
jgi:hypothetical protein